MNQEEKTRLAAWRAQARADVRRLRFWMMLAGFYAITFLSVAALDFILSFIIPLLPWISKPYVSPDPPALVLAFHCANFVVGFIVFMLPLIYFWGPSRKAPFLSKQDRRSKKLT